MTPKFWKYTHSQQHNSAPEADSDLGKAESLHHHPRTEREAMALIWRGKKKKTRRIKETSISFEETVG
jgi:hypothetical protein